MNTVRLRIWLALGFLLAMVPSQGWGADVESCSSVDEDAYTLYVYGDSDARILLDQRCQDPSGQSLMDKVVARAECRCYDQKVSDVLAQLTSGTGPVAVTTRKLMAVGGAAVTCRSALEQCQSACTQSAQSAPKPCSQVRTAGITIY